MLLSNNVNAKPKKVLTNFNKFTNFITNNKLNIIYITMIVFCILTTIILTGDEPEKKYTTPSYQDLKDKIAKTESGLVIFTIFLVYFVISNDNLRDEITQLKKTQNKISPFNYNYNWQQTQIITQPSPTQIHNFNKNGINFLEQQRVNSNIVF